MTFAVMLHHESFVAVGTMKRQVGIFLSFYYLFFIYFSFVGGLQHWGSLYTGIVYLNSIVSINVQLLYTGVAGHGEDDRGSTIAG